MKTFRIIAGIGGAIAFAIFAADRPRAHPFLASIIGFFAGMFAAILAEVFCEWLSLPLQQKKDAVIGLGRFAGNLAFGLVVYVVSTLVIFGGIGLLLRGLFGVR